MAGPTVDILLKARDEATGVLKRVSGELGFLSSAAQRLSSGLGVWGGIAAAVVTAGAAVVAAGKQFADSVEQLERLHDVTGVSIQRIQSLRKVFEEAGLGADAADSALKKLAREIGDNNPLLKQYGITSRDTGVALLQLAGAIERTRDTGTRQLLTTSLLGKSMDETAGIVRNLGATWDSTHQRMANAGALYRDDLIPAAADLDKQLDELALSWQGMWTGMVSVAVPAATRILLILRSTMDAATVTGEAFLLLKRTLEGEIDPKTFSRTLTHLQTFSSAIIKAAAAMQGDLPSGPRGTSPAVGGSGSPGSGDDARTKRIKDLARVLGVSAGVARDFLAVLEEIETAKKRAGLADDLRAAAFAGLGLGEQGPLTEAQTALGSGLRDLLGQIGQDSGADARLRDTDQPNLPTPEAVQEITARFPELQQAIEDARASYGTLVNEILSTSGVVSGTLEATWYGLQSGLGSVFSNLTNKMQTLRSALKSILDAIIQEFAQLAAKLVATGIFKLILGAVFPGAGAGAGTAINLVGSARAGAARTAAPAGAGGATTVIFNSWSARDAYLQLMSPTGQLRGAAETIAFHGAY